MKRVLSVLLLVCLLAGCGAPPATSSSPATSSQPVSEAPVVAPVPEPGIYLADSGQRLWLERDGTFLLVCEPSRQFVPGGSYTVEEGILTAVDELFDETYQFRAEDEHTLTFLKEGSTDFITQQSGGMELSATPLPDGLTLEWMDADAWWAAQTEPLSGFYRADKDRQWFICLSAEDHTFYLYNNDPTGRTMSGTYVVEGDKLTATTSEGLRFTYRIWANQILAFIDEESDSLPLWHFGVDVTAQNATNENFHWMNDVACRSYFEDVAPPPRLTQAEMLDPFNYIDLYDSCWHYATQEQRRALEEIPQVECCGSPMMGVYARAVLTIMGALPEDQSRLTLEHAQTSCAYVDAQGYEEHAELRRALLEEFNVLAGAPDYHGGSGTMYTIWLLNDEGTEYIRLSMSGLVTYVNEVTGERMHLYPYEE